MGRSCFQWILVFAVATLTVGLTTCAHDRELVSIAIQPSSVTFQTPARGPQVIFTALGSFVHPPVTKDITNQVTWKADIPSLITLNAGVVSPTGAGCGITNISASTSTGTAPSGTLVIAFATVTVKDPTDPLCPGGSSTQSVLTVTPRGSGSVTSSPAGINCPSQTCGAQFQTGSTVTLTATPSPGSSFVSWTNCTSTSGNACTVVVNGDMNVIATFNP